MNALQQIDLPQEQMYFQATPRFILEHSEPGSVNSEFECGNF